MLYQTSEKASSLNQLILLNKQKNALSVPSLHKNCSNQYSRTLRAQYD